MPAAALAIANTTPDQPAVLAARPRGVLHVYRGPLTPGGRCTPRHRRPVCNRRGRRLYVVAALPPWGSAVGGRRLCRSCERRLAQRTAVALGQPCTLPHTAESVVWSAYAAKTEAELDACRHALLVDVPTAQQWAPVELPPEAARRWGRDRLTAAQAIAAERKLIRTRAARARLDQTTGEVAAAI